MMTIEEEIRQLKKEHQALILAHNYTRSEVQDVADFVGDGQDIVAGIDRTASESSFGLSDGGYGITGSGREIQETPS